MFSPENHVVGVRIDCKTIFDSLSDTDLLALVGADADTLEIRGMSYLSEEGFERAVLCRTTIQRESLEIHYMQQYLASQVRRDNWIRTYRGTAIGKSEESCNADEEFLIIGIVTHDVLVGLNKNMKDVRVWLADHLSSYGVKSEPADIKYYHLTTYI